MVDGRSSSAVRTRHGGRTCLCKQADCQGLTAAFLLLHDPRKKFVKLASYKQVPSSRHYVRRNQQRQSYLQCLLPDHPVSQETTTRSIALHHFSPRLVELLSYDDDGKTKRELPQSITEAVLRTITEEEMQEWQINKEDCDRLLDKDGMPTGDFYFKPNYPVHKVRQDLIDLIAQIRDKSSAKCEDNDATVAEEEMIFVDDRGADQEGIPSIVRREENDATVAEEEMVVVDDKEGVSSIAKREEKEATVAEEEMVVIDDKDDADLEGVPSIAKREEKDVTFDKEEMIVLDDKDDPDLECIPRIVKIADRKAPMAPEEGSATENIPVDVVVTDGGQASVESGSRGSRIRFSVVEFREHPIIPGDNPGGLRGPPLSIDWDSVGEFSASVDDYERERPPRRTFAEMSIPPFIRRQILRNMGYTSREIQKCTKRATIDRNKRRRTNEMSHMSSVHELTERIHRATLNATVRRKAKKKEREFLQQAFYLDRLRAEEQYQRYEQYETNTLESSLTDGCEDNLQATRSLCTLESSLGDVGEPESTRTL